MNIGPPARRLFLHYFDVHFLEARAVSNITTNVLNEASLATRLGILASDELFIPLASLYESDLTSRVLQPFADGFWMGVIYSIGRGKSVDEFLENKAPQYGARTAIGQRYRNSLHHFVEPPPFHEKLASTTRDIEVRWSSHLGGPAIPALHASGTTLPVDFEKRWEVFRRTSRAKRSSLIT